MKLLVISSAPFIKKNNTLYAYAPYIKELEIWNKQVTNISFCNPFWENENDLLITEIPFTINKIYKLKDFNTLDFQSSIQSFFQVFYNSIKIFYSITQHDIIHIRCPGNIGLLACVIQIFFPLKKKIVKYAGNWDPESKQPISYKIQKWILNSTIFTHNTKVLVYGKWMGASKNIIPFFTASYSKLEDEAVFERDFTGKISFIFVGTLTAGKRIIYALKIIQQLHQKGFSVEMNIFGDGEQRKNVEKFIKDYDLQKIVFLNGNIDKNQIKEAYKKNHFIILPSKSEGWPKVIAEAMFWGCLPIATTVSCLPYMLDYGNRGLLLNMDLEKDVNNIIELVSNFDSYLSKTSEATIWSRAYTIEKFEEEIKNLLNN